MAETAILRAMADNAAAKERRGGPGRPFQPGRSANPAGKAKPVRPKARRIDFPGRSRQIKNKFSSFVKLPGAMGEWCQNFRDVPILLQKSPRRARATAALRREASYRAL
jgi:hypothetical protein